MHVYKRYEKVLPYYHPNRKTHGGWMGGTFEQIQNPTLVSMVLDFVKWQERATQKPKIGSNYLMKVLHCFV